MFPVPLFDRRTRTVLGKGITLRVQSVGRKFTMSHFGCMLTKP